MTTGQQSEQAASDFGLYIHWPYCQAKCPYCDFNSYARQTVSEERYLAACLAELDHYAALVPRREVASIFFGGGTPSLMTPATVAAILGHIASRWRVATDAEITLEANPSSVEASRFAGYRAAGVNRVSIGVQSLSDAALRFLGRLHSRAEAIAALRVAGAHFERCSFDMIYARPGQTMADWRGELAEALTMAQGHLSLYQLTIEPGTAFFDLERRGKLRVPEGEHAAELYSLTQEMCAEAGLPAYEISNHAAPGHASRHNLIYWRYGDYAGIGPGAHGRLSTPEGRLAISALRDPKRWVESVEGTGRGIETREMLSVHDQALEMLLMGLRLSEGLDLAALERATGYTVNGAVIRRLAREGLLHPGEQAFLLRVTPKGRLLLNAVIAALAGHLEQHGHGHGRNALAVLPV